MTAEGMIDLYHNRPALAEVELRRVFESRADSSVRRLAYKGLQTILTFEQRYAALESLENRALPDGLVNDTTDWLTARALAGIGACGIQVSRQVTRLPIHLSITGCPVLQARVNGGKPIDFWLDTGASVSVLSEGMAQRMGVRMVSRDTGYAGAAVRSKVMFRFGVVDSLMIDDMVVRNLPVLVMRQQDLSLGIPGFGIDGIIGWSLISCFRTVIDYPGKSISFQYPVAETAAVPNLFRLGSVPCVRVRVDSSGPLNFVLDSGAQVSILDEAGLGRLLPVPKPTNYPGCIAGAGGGGLRNMRLIRATRIVIGGQSLTPVALTVYSLPFQDLPIVPDGLLGGDVLHNFIVTIDAENGIMSLN